MKKAKKRKCGNCVYRDINNCYAHSKKIIFNDFNETDCAVEYTTLKINKRHINELHCNKHQFATGSNFYKLEDIIDDRIN